MWVINNLCRESMPSRCNSTCTDSITTRKHVCINSKWFPAMRPKSLTSVINRRSVSDCAIYRRTVRHACNWIYRWSENDLAFSINIHWSHEEDIIPSIVYRHTNHDIWYKYTIKLWAYSDPKLFVMRIVRLLFCFVLDMVAQIGYGLIKYTVWYISIKLHAISQYGFQHNCNLSRR